MLSCDMMSGSRDAAPPEKCPPGMTGVSPRMSRTMPWDAAHSRKKDRAHKRTRSDPTAAQSDPHAAPIGPGTPPRSDPALRPSRGPNQTQPRNRVRTNSLETLSHRPHSTLWHDILIGFLSWTYGFCIMLRFRLLTRDENELSSHAGCIML